MQHIRNLTFSFDSCQCQTFGMEQDLLIDEEIVDAERYKFTFPKGNFFRNSSLLFVSPNLKSGGLDTTVKLALLYLAAISAL